MKYIIILFLLSINVLGQSSSQQLKNNIIFPVEVFGKNGVIESVNFNINDASNLTNIAGLRLKIHGLTYTNKASVKVNNSKWYDINNSNVVYLNTYEKIFQGMGNTYFTGPVSTFNLFVSIPHTNFYSTNIIRFKFNDFNGLTIGYRVLDIGVVNSNYTDLVLHTKKIQDDPSKWRPFSTNIANINNGSNKWFNASITHNGIPIRAKCEDCHVHEGYDLKYFNYSNKSIVLRSTALHSLSLQDAQDIASFIRTRNVPYEEKGRPWNPPYQPGPGMDSKPVRSWAAGAGLEWVLMDDSLILTNIFPTGVSSGLINYGTNGLQAYTPLLTLNQREIPTLIPMPDWNRWLPHIHPLDAWGDWYGVNYYPTTTTKMLGVYHEFYNTFKNLTDKTQAPALLENFGTRVSEQNYYIHVQPDGATPSIDSRPHGTIQSKEYADFALKVMSDFKWMNVKAFEFMKIFEFEELGYTQGYWSDKRRWYGSTTRNLFFTAPHVKGTPSFSSQIKGMVPYGGWINESASWYHLAVILNSGNRNNIDQTPVDQAYYTSFGTKMFWGSDPSFQWGDWTNRPVGMVILTLMKANEFTEKGATNIPNGIGGTNGIIGYYPNPATAQSYNQLFSEDQWNNTDKTLMTQLVNIYVQKYCDMVVRFTAAQYNIPGYTATYGQELYETLVRWQKDCNFLQTKYNVNLNTTISKLVTTKNTIFPTPP